MNQSPRQRAGASPGGPPSREGKLLSILLCGNCPFLAARAPISETPSIGAVFIAVITCRYPAIILSLAGRLRKGVERVAFLRCSILILLRVSILRKSCRSGADKDSNANRNL